MGKFIGFQDIDGKEHLVGQHVITRMEFVERVGDSVFQHGRGYYLKFSDGSHAWVYEGEGKRIAAKLTEERRA